jgi:hypothetical protein
LKCDGTLNDNAKWVAIWTPMWIVDIVLLVSAGIVLMDRGSKNHGEGNEESTPEGDDVISDKIPLSEKLSNLFTTCFFILIQIFVLIRLDEYTNWSWFLVFIPWFAYEGVSIIASFPTAFLTKVTPPNHESIQLTPIDAETGNNSEDELFMAKIQAETEYFEKLLEIDREKRFIVIHLLRIWLAIFLALQLDHDVDWNWGLVLLPIWVYLFFHYIYAGIYRLWAQKTMVDIDVVSIEAGLMTDPMQLVKYQQANMLYSNSVFMCFGQIFPLFMAIMLVCRLQISSYSTFFIILPIFLIIGCCCCMVCCGLIGMSIVDMDSLEEEIATAQGGVARNGNGGGGAGEGEEGAGKSDYNPPAAGGIDGEYDTFAVGGDGNTGSHKSPLQTMEEGKKNIETTNLSNRGVTSPHTQSVSEKDKLINASTIDLDID